MFAFLEILEVMSCRWQVKVGALLKSYLKQSVVLLEDPAILLSSLKEPIPRQVLDAVIRCADVSGLLALLGQTLLSHC
jgi:hypothetical protein